MEEKNVKGNNKPIIIIIVIIAVIGAFFGGYFLKELTEEKTKCNAPLEKEGKEPKEEEQKLTTSVMDNLVVNLYDGGYIYFIFDDSLYYLEADLLEDGRFFLLTYASCLRDSAGEDGPYCEGNPVYKRKAVKVEGIEDVVKIRLLHRPGATDESFETFAIDKAGNAYILKKSSASKYYGNNDVEDLLNENTAILKDGSQKTIN